MSIRALLPSIINIDVVGPDKLKLLNVIQNLSADYIKIASDTKKEKLTTGIDFLNKEMPILTK